MLKRKLNLLILAKISELNRAWKAILIKCCLVALMTGACTDHLGMQMMKNEKEKEEEKGGQIVPVNTEQVVPVHEDNNLSISSMPFSSDQQGVVGINNQETISRQLGEYSLNAHIDDIRNDSRVRAHEAKPYFNEFVTSCERYITLKNLIESNGGFVCQTYFPHDWQIKYLEALEEKETILQMIRKEHKSNLQRIEKEKNQQLALREQELKQEEGRLGKELQLLDKRVKEELEIEKLKNEQINAFKAKEAKLEAENIEIMTIAKAQENQENERHANIIKDESLVMAYGEALELYEKELVQMHYVIKGNSSSYNIKAIPPKIVEYNGERIVKPGEVGWHATN